MRHFSRTNCRTLAAAPTVSQIPSRYAAEAAQSPSQTGASRCSLPPYLPDGYRGEGMRPLPPFLALACVLIHMICL